MTRIARIGSKIIALRPQKVKGDAEVAEVVVVNLKPHKPALYTGTCHCGAVTYRARDVSDIWYCHCKQCQHLTGFYIAAAGVKRENLTIMGAVNWLPISETSKSGHCQSCGSYMFWDSERFDTISLLVGNLDETTGLDVKGHIYVSEKGDYYEITDNLPQFDLNPPRGTR